MKRGLILAFVTVGFVMLFGSWTVASADGDNKSDFALFDGTNPANQGAAGVANPLPKGVAGAVCGGTKPGKAFTFHVTVTNHSSGAPGFVRLTYKDGDFVQFPLAPGGSFSFSQAGGSKGGADRAVRISGVPGGATGTRLVGAMSILSAEDGKPFCVSCDATTEGGVGDAGCDAKVPD